MKILVVDDIPEQLELAKRLLSPNTVETAQGWTEAKKRLVSKGEYNKDLYNNPEGFDVVLTDMMMPGEGEGLADKSRVGEPVPYGFNVALLALRCGVSKVAVVSNGQGDDGNHHENPTLWACDTLNGFCFASRLMFFTGYDCPYMNDDRPEVKGNDSPYHLKDWGKVLEDLLAATY